MSTTTTTCTKCNGTGFIPRFADTAHGVCFDCDGTGAVAPHDTPTPTTMSLATAFAHGDLTTATDADLILAFEVLNNYVGKTGSPRVAADRALVTAEMVRRAEIARRERSAAVAARREARRAARVGA